MALNISSAFKAKNNIKKNLKSEFKSMKFIGIDLQEDSKPRVYLGTVIKNWYYERRIEPKTQLIVETVYFCPTNDTQSNWMRDAQNLELVRADNTFLRFNFGVKLKPAPYRYEWQVIVRPNDQDVVSIT